MFDLLFLVVVGLSTAFAAMRGGLRELSTLLALGLAGGLTWVLTPLLLSATGLAGSFIGAAALTVILLGVLFIAIHIGLHLALKRTPLEGRAALADKIGGGAFGLFRGLVLVGLGYLGFSYYLDEERQPDSVRNAVTKPIAAGMASWFDGLTPDDAYIESVAPEDDGAAADAAADGYARSDRNGMEEIITTVTTTDPAIAAESPQTDETSLEDSIADILITTENSPQGDEQ